MQPKQQEPQVLWLVNCRYTTGVTFSYFISDFVWVIAQKGKKSTGKHWKNSGARLPYIAIVTILNWHSRRPRCHVNVSVLPRKEFATAAPTLEQQIRRILQVSQESSSRAGSWMRWATGLVYTLSFRSMLADLKHPLWLKVVLMTLPRGHWALGSWGSITWTTESMASSQMTDSDTAFTGPSSLARKLSAAVMHPPTNSVSGISHIS